MTGSKAAKLPIIGNVATGRNDKPNEAVTIQSVAVTEKNK